MWVLAGTMATGATCEAVQADVSADGVVGFALRGVRGELRVVGGPGPSVVVAGEVCDGARVKLAREDEVLTLRARGRGRADLVVQVPASVAAVSVWRHEGHVTVGEHPGRIAVASGVGPVDVGRVGHLRLSHVVGDVVVGGVVGDLVVDGVDGSLTVGEVGGRRSVAGVTRGPGPS